MQPLGRGASAGHLQELWLHDDPRLGVLPALPWGAPSRASLRRRAAAHRCSRGVGSWRRNDRCAEQDGARTRLGAGDQRPWLDISWPACDRRAHRVGIGDNPGDNSIGAGGYTGSTAPYVVSGVSLCAGPWIVSSAIRLAAGARAARRVAVPNGGPRCRVAAVDRDRRRSHAL